MHTLGNAIKLLARQERDSSNPTDLRYGVVISDREKGEPLEIRITPTFILPLALLIVPTRLVGTLDRGDRVALLRESGGRKYFILDKF